MLVETRLRSLKEQSQIVETVRKRKARVQITRTGMFYYRPATGFNSKLRNASAVGVP